jgi:hypothetical protein
LLQQLTRVYSVAAVLNLLSCYSYPAVSLVRFGRWFDHGLVFRQWTYNQKAFSLPFNQEVSVRDVDLFFSSYDSYMCGLCEMKEIGTCSETQNVP